MGTGLGIKSGRVGDQARMNGGPPGGGRHSRRENLAIHGSTVTGSEHRSVRDRVGSKFEKPGMGLGSGWDRGGITLGSSGMNRGGGRGARIAVIARDRPTSPSSENAKPGQPRISRGDANRKNSARESRRSTLIENARPSCENRVTAYVHHHCPDHPRDH
jgi:hypothetical protein